MPRMNPPQYIRRIVFGMSQKAFAEALGVHQPTVSAWEASGRINSKHAAAVRALAKDMGKVWSDGWFFETPED